MRGLSKKILVLAYFGWSHAAFGQMLANPALNGSPDHALVDGGLAFQKVEYQYETSADVQRKLLFGAFGFAFNPKFDFFGQLAYIFSSEFEDLSEVKGSGLMYGFGPRFIPYATKTARVEGYGLVNMTTEEFKGGSDVKLEQETTDIHLGSTVSYTAAPNTRPYFGLDLLLNSDGKLKTKVGDLSLGRTKVRRNDTITIRLGANFPFNGIGFRPELMLAGEQTITLSVWTIL